MFREKSGKKRKRKNEKVSFIMNKDEMKQSCDNGNFSMVLNLFSRFTKRMKEKKNATSLRYLSFGRSD